MSEEARKALFDAGCTSPDGTFVHAPTDKVIAALRSQPGTLAREAELERVLRECARLIDSGGDPTALSRDVLTKLIYRTLTPSHEAGTQDNRSIAEEFCKGAFGPFVSDVSQYVEIVAELLDHASERALKGIAITATPSEAGTQEPVAVAARSTDEEALALVMNMLQWIADTALAGFKGDTLDEATALCNINNTTRDMIDALAKRRVS